MADSAVRPGSSHPKRMAATLSPKEPLHPARIKHDLKRLHKDPLPGICVWIDPSNMMVIYALFTGLVDTPYFGGFFTVKLTLPYDYPHNPPKGEFLTTSGGRVRFGPNLYANGKICLSILGTWSGPSWSAAQTISTVLISIQSLMNDQPYFNEPGYENQTKSKVMESRAYNEIITHETIRVAFCDELEGVGKIQPCEEFCQVIRAVAGTFLPHHLEFCKANKAKHGKPMNDPHRDARGSFVYATLIARLEKLAKQFPDSD